MSLENFFRPCILDLCAAFNAYCASSSMADFKSNKDSYKQDLVQMAQVFETIYQHLENNDVKQKLKIFISAVKAAKRIDDILEHEFFNEGSFSQRKNI